MTSEQQHDEYSPEPQRYVRKGGTRTMSESMNSIGKGETDLQDILSSLGVSFQASGKDTFVRVWGRFDKHRHPVCFYPDALIDDYDFGSGVILVNGDIHRTKGQMKRDDNAKDGYTAQGLWIEEVSPSEAKKTETVKELMERHRIRRDEYGGQL